MNQDEKLEEKQEKELDEEKEKVYLLFNTKMDNWQMNWLIDQSINILVH